MRLIIPAIKLVKFSDLYKTSCCPKRNLDYPRLPAGSLYYAVQNAPTSCFRLFGNLSFAVVKKCFSFFDCTEGGRVLQGLNNVVLS
jgi:hypothetical protein